METSIDGENTMIIESVKLVYFSPTGTTKAVVRGIARGLDPGNVEVRDITLPDARIEPLQVSENDLLVIGVPVYRGRVPALLAGWLHALSARNTPAVCVVVYGNRIYDDALIELGDILTQRGCRPIAGAVYIGEHSLSTDDVPIAPGRPDAGDLFHAESFGRKIQEKLDAIPSADRITDIALPGCRPYRGDSRLQAADFIAVGDACIQCGICAEVCPVGAIDPEESRRIDTAACITCCACIKNCPQHARSIKPGSVHDMSVRLHALCGERKEPECFL